MPDVIYEKRDGVATITLNRPERRNAFSPESIIRLAEAWIDYRDDDDLRVAILTGAGDQGLLRRRGSRACSRSSRAPRSPTTSGASA